MTDIAPFRPENYPRTYKQPTEGAVFYYIMAGFGGFLGIFCLLVVAFKYHGDLAAGGTCSAVGILGLIAGLVGFSLARAPRLILTADAIEYRNVTSIYIATKRMRRDDIKGVNTVDYCIGGGGRNGMSSYGTSFLPKDEKGSAIFIPEYIFALDEAYDAWVGNLPYLGGLYTCSPFSSSKPGRLTAEDFSRVEWRNHKWRPRKE